MASGVSTPIGVVAAILRLAIRRRSFEVIELMRTTFWASHTHVFAWSRAVV